MECTTCCHCGAGDTKLVGFICDVHGRDGRRCTDEALCRHLYVTREQRFGKWPRPSTKALQEAFATSKLEAEARRLLCLRAPWWRERVMPFCYGRAITAKCWDPGTTPTKDKSCPRCWGKWVEWQLQDPNKAHPDGYHRSVA